MPAAAIYSAGIVLLPPYIVPVATIYSAGIVLLPLTHRHKDTIEGPLL